MTSQVSLIWKNRSTYYDIDDEMTCEVLYRNGQKISGLNRNRVRIYYEQGNNRVYVDQEQKISSLHQNEFFIRDLGPQFSYRGVFYLEYLGPLLIWPLMKFFIPQQSNTYLIVSSAMWTFHYVKRLLETQFVHTFSHQTMPLFNLFKNCTYYWGCALLIAYFVQTKSSHVGEVSSLQNTMIPFFYVCEALNGLCHLQLKALRPKGSKAHLLPKGFLFNFITCPNYTMEILSWICFSIYVQVWPSYIFTFFGAIQMFIWADKKRKSLIKEFPQVRKRGRITPFPFL